VPVDDDAIFHDDWEKRTFALNLLATPSTGLLTDFFRHSIERISWTDYLAIGYFGRWLRGVETKLVEGGVLAAGAVEARMNGLPTPTDPPVRTAPATPLSEPGARRDIGREPLYEVDDRVRVRHYRPAGHTRLPGYVRDRVGTVVRVNGGWVFPDTMAHGRGENPTWVYAVRFEAEELWGGDSDCRDVVIVDMFEPYLEAESENIST
jgi:nitrile hydratase